MVDVTAFCKTIVKAVRDMCTGSKRQTLLYMSDVFKGANTTKIRSHQHERSPYYAHLKTWLATDIQRLLHKMVLDDLLKEELIFFKDIPQAYLRLGMKVESLMNGPLKVEFPLKVAEAKSRTKIAETAAKNDTPTDDASGADEPSLPASNPLVIDDATAALLAELKDKCHNDLLDVCRTMASQRGVTMISIMNMQAIKAMSERMPETEEDMLLIPHVTPANFVKFGKQLLEITQQYAAEKLCKFVELWHCDFA